MKLNNKEQKIKEILDDLNFELDTDLLWNEVNTELEKDKKKRRIWFIPFFLIGLTAVYFLLQGENTSLTNKNATLVETAQPSELIDNNVNSKTNLDVIENQPTVNNKKETNNTNQLATTISKTSKTIKNETSISNTKNTRNNSKVVDTKTQKTKNSTLSTIQQNPFTSATKNTKPIGNKSSLVNRDLMKNISALSPITITSLLSNNVLNTNETLSQSLRQTFPLIKKGPGLMYTINSGILFGQNKNLNVNSSSQEFDTQHFEREQTLPSLSLEAGISFATKSRVIIGGGIAYSNFVSRYKDSRNTIDNETVDGTEFIYLDSNNNPTEEAGQLNKTTSINNNLQWHRQHKQYDVYLSIAKPFLYFSKFSLTPEFTLLHNLSSNHSGYYFADNSEGFQKIENKNDHPYTSNTGLKGQVGLNVSYGTGKTTLGLKAIYRNNFKNLTESKHFYSIRNSQYGLQLTMTYRPTWE